MTLNADEKKMLSEIRMQKALEFLGDARSNLDNKRYRTSVNRSYYAALNALRSLLILDGANPESHDGVITMISLRFIKTGVLPVDIVKNFKILLSRRTDVDYGDFDNINEDDAKESYTIASSIIETVNYTRQKLV
ncbi:MAG: HEPN domain-containing protein [Spirochaetota bacterium]